MHFLLVFLSVVLGAFQTLANPKESLSLHISAFRLSECREDTTSIPSGSDCLIWLSYRGELIGPDSSLYGNRKLFDSVKLHIRSRSARGSNLLDSAAVNLLPVKTYSQDILSQFWRSDPASVQPVLWRRDACYSIRCPDWLENSTLEISASVEIDGRRLVSNTDFIRIVPPCDAVDTLMAMRSHLYVEWLARRTHYMSHGAEKKSLREFRDARRGVIPAEYLSGCWSWFDQHVGDDASYDYNVRQSVDVMFSLPEPTPNPLRDYRTLLIEERARRLGNRNFLRHDPGRLECILRGLTTLNSEGGLPRTRIFAGCPSTLIVRWIPREEPECQAFRERAAPEDTPAVVLTDRGLPEGLILEAWLVDARGDTGDASRDLFQQLQPVLHTQFDHSYSFPRAALEFHFDVTPPASFAGRRIGIKATYTRREWLPTESDVTKPALSDYAGALVVRAETRQDSLDLFDVRLRNLNDQTRFSETLALADSLLNAGYLTATVFSAASYAASRDRQLPTRLKLLDMEFRETGGSDLRIRCGNGEPAPRDPVAGQKQYYATRDPLVEEMRTGRRIEANSPCIQLRLTGWRVSDCDSTPGNLLTGGPALLEAVMSVMEEDGALYAERGLSDGWPVGLMIECREEDDEGGPITQYGDARLLFDYELHHTPSLEYREGILQAHRYSSRQAWYSLRFVPPPALAGRNFAFRASYTGPTGRVMTSINELRFRLVAPCNERDEANAAAMAAYFEWITGNCDGALGCADSLLQRNCASPLTLFVGWQAAHQSGQWSRAMDYLDLAYRTFGYAGVVPAARIDDRRGHNDVYLQYRSRLQNRLPPQQPPAPRL